MPLSRLINACAVVVEFIVRPVKFIVWLELSLPFVTDWSGFTVSPATATLPVPVLLTVNVPLTLSIEVGPVPETVSVPPLPLTFLTTVSALLLLIILEFPDTLKLFITNIGSAT